MQVLLIHELCKDPCKGAPCPTSTGPRLQGSPVGPSETTYCAGPLQTNIRDHKISSRTTPLLLSPGQRGGFHERNSHIRIQCCLLDALLFETLSFWGLVVGLERLSGLAWGNARRARRDRQWPFEKPDPYLERHREVGALWLYGWREGCKERSIYSVELVHLL